MLGNKWKRFLATALCGCMLGSTILSAAVPLKANAEEVPHEDWETIQAMVSRYYGEWMDTTYPNAITDKMPDTAILGNGDVGITSGGSDTEKTFYISKGDFWTYNGNPLPIGGVTISEEKEETVEEDKGENLARSAMTFSASSTHEAFHPSRAVDGVKNDEGWVSGIQDNQESGFWLQLEFETAITFNRYILYSDGGVRQGQDANNTKAFQLQISENGQGWITVDNVTGNTLGIYDKVLNSSVTTKYVRVYITEPVQSGDARARIGELELYLSEESDNLALNKPVTVCCENNDNGIQYGSYMVDGNMTENKWCAVHSAENVKKHWAIIDLGEAKNIGSYEVKHAGVAGEAVHNTEAYELQYLDQNTYTNVNWGLIDTLGDSSWIGTGEVVNTNAENSTSKTLDEAIKARYIRLLVTDPCVEESDNTARIHELILLEPEQQQESAPELDTANNKWCADDNDKTTRIFEPVLSNDMPRTAEAQEIAEINEAPVVIDYQDAKVKVCSQFTDGGTTHAGTNLIDGEDSTKWCAQHKEDHWAVVDLGAEKTIGYYELYHENSHITKAWKLQYLNAQGEWADMDVVSENSTDITKKELLESHTARYVRLLITDGCGICSDDSDNVARINEIVLMAEKPVVEEPKKEPAPVTGPFNEKQDILNAEIRTTQTIAGMGTEMTTWLAADCNLLVTRITAASNPEMEEGASFQVQTWATINEVSKKPVTAEHSDENGTVTITRSTENKHTGVTDAFVSKVALSTKIIGADGVTVSSNNERGTGILRFKLQPGTTVYVVTAIGGGGRTYKENGQLFDTSVKEPVAEADEILSAITDADSIDTVNAARQAWWKDYWSTSFVNLGGKDGDALDKIQKYYYGAQYIMGSMTKNGEIAAGLYGIWHTNDHATWSSDYHLNYNFISAYYGTFSSNRPDLSLPAINVLLDYMETGKAKASSVSELKRISESFVNSKIEAGDIDAQNGIENAILYPVGIGPWGMTLDNSYHNEALNAAYSIYLMTQYYDYTMDKMFLEDGVYDYMKAVAAFYESWLVEEDGIYVLYAGYNEGSWAKNPAVELAALKSTLKELIAASELLGKDEDKRIIWQKMLDCLAEQPTTEVNGKTVLALAEEEYKDGQWQKMTSPIPGDGNAIPLDAMIPGELYGYFSSESELQMVKDTIDVFSERGAWSQQNNFPRIFVEAVKSGYHIETIVEKLVDVIHSQMKANLRISDGTHGVEKVGTIAAINSMLLISEKDSHDVTTTKIFPNWYEDKDASFQNLRTEGAFLVSAEYDGTKEEAKEGISVTSEAGGNMTMVIPWAEGAEVRDENGNKVIAATGQASNGEATITFEIPKDKTYTIWKPTDDNNYDTTQNPEDSNNNDTTSSPIPNKPVASKNDGSSVQKVENIKITTGTNGAETGDFAPIEPLMAVMVFAGATVCVMMKRKQKKA